MFANDTISGSYAKHMEKEHDGSKWGSTGARYSGKAVAEVISSRPYIQTALDYGCGKGTMAQHFDSLEWSEYDPGVVGKQERPKGRYDLVTCTDVMEHVEYEFVEEVIKELGNATGKVLFVDIACYPTGKLFGEGPYKGEDLHITLMAPSEWRDLFDELVGLQRLEARSISKLSKGKMKERVQLTYERV